MLLESGNKCLSNNCTQIRFVYFLKCATWVTIIELQKLHIKNMKKKIQARWYTLLIQHSGGREQAGLLGPFWST